MAYHPSDDVRLIPEIVYTRYSGRELRLDLYVPAEPPGEPIPGIVVIRGGGFRRGDKEGFAFVADYLAQAGLAAASIEYRTSQEARFPAAVQDAKAAVRWIRAHAGSYRINGSAIGAIGSSSGGYLALMLATTHGIPEFEGSGGKDTVSDRVQAAVSMAGPTNLISRFESEAQVVSGRDTARSRVETFLGQSLDQARDLWEAASPVTYVDRHAAPVLLIHGQSDQTVPYLQSLELVERYQHVGARAALLGIPGAPHSFWRYTRWFEDSMDRSVAFFRETLQVSPR